MNKNFSKLSFFRIDAVMVREETKHVAVQRSIGIYLVTGLTVSGLTDCIFLKAFLLKG
jgi:hypothetical protein